MAEIKAFRALRFDTAVAGKIDELVCPPYDIIRNSVRHTLMRTKTTLSDLNFQEVKILMRTHKQHLKSGLMQAF